MGTQLLAQETEAPVPRFSLVVPVSLSLGVADAPSSPPPRSLISPPSSISKTHAIHGTRPQEQPAAYAILGVFWVGKMDSGIGVCADTPDASWRAREALQVRWKNKDVSPTCLP